MKLTVFMILPIFWKFECWAKPVEQGSGTETVVVEATPYPDMQKRYVDINNVSPEVSSILKLNNLNLDEIKSMHARLQNKTVKDINFNFYELIPSSTYSTPTAAKE